MAHPDAPIMLSTVRAHAHAAVADYRLRQLAIERAAHELEVLLRESAGQGLPVTGARAVTVTRLTIGTYQAALAILQAEVDQAAGLARG